MMETKTKYLFLLLVVGGVMFFHNLGGRDLWEPDETRYAVAAREMRETGNWMLPHLNGEVYAEKPPLFFWFVNLSVFCLGKDTELAIRFPSALAGLAIVVLTFFFGSELFNLRTGLFSSLALATCFFFLQLSRWVMLDSLFTFLFFLSLFCLYKGFEREEGRQKRYLLAGLFMALGVLTKGPIAYLVIIILVLLGLFQKQMTAIWNRKLLFGVLFSFGVVFLWLLPACCAGGEDYTRRILLGQTIGRLTGTEKHFHPESIFFYFLRFPIDFFPWIVFLPASILSGLQRRKDLKKGFLFLIVWFLAVFFFFNLSKGKKDNYLLPLYPAAAMMIGLFWDSELGDLERRRGLVWGLVFLTLLFLSGVILFGTGIAEKLYPALIGYHSLGLWGLLYFLLGSFLSVLLILKRKKRASFITFTVTLMFFHLFLSGVLLPGFNSQLSMREFSAGVLKRMKPGDELKTMYPKYYGLLYYTRRPYIEEIKEGNQLDQAFRSPQRVYVVVQTKRLEQIRKSEEIQVETVEQIKVGNQCLSLISNQQ